MDILLFSMPDSFEHMPAFAIRMPSGALTSLAGNVDRHHQVSAADLILVQDRVRGVVERLLADLKPDLVGLSVMTFQRITALKIIGLIRRLRPQARIVAGGYDPSMVPEPYFAIPDAAVDYVVRGEGEITFRELVRALEAGTGVDTLAGLTYRRGTALHHNPDRPVSSLKDGEIRLPNRAARVLRGYTLLGRPIDVIETSRGCTYDCSFCSIVEMRGRNFHVFDLERVLADIRDACARGARALFVVDDNISLNVTRFEGLCRAIADSGLNRVDYTVQATTSSIANHGARLAPLMRRAGFRYVFLGIENVLENDLRFLRAGRKNTPRPNGRDTRSAAIRAIEHLHRNDMYVVGGLIVGNPDDTREAIGANLEFARRYVDWPYIQHPTPYPRTAMARDFHERGLVVSEQPEEYDGTTAVVRTRHLSGEEVEFMRWRAERWMKLHHMPAAIRRSPVFVLRHGYKMLAHTFRGSSIRSLLGLEDEWECFQRYRDIRRAERRERIRDL
jgi:anaerobic magnesium-protoporphyrin IX monomethyl ester cyclase